MTAATEIGVATTPGAACARGAAPASRSFAEWDEAEYLATLDEEIAACGISGDSALSTREFGRLLFERGYITSAPNVVGMYTAIVTGRPILFFGPPGCGKTFAVEVLHQIFSPGEDFLFVSMHEEVRPEHLLYREDEYGRKVLWERLEREARATGRELDWDEAERQVQAKIVPGPLLRAILEGNAKSSPRVVCVDEIDKAKPETEYALLDFMNSRRLAVPYVGIFEADEGCAPIMGITANKARPLSEPFESRVFAIEVHLPTLLEERFVFRKQVPHLDEEAMTVLLLYTHRLRETLRINAISIREAKNLARVVADFGITGRDGITSNFLLAHAGMYAKNGPDLNLLRLHVKDTLRWVHKELDRQGDSEFLLRRINEKQLRLRRSDEPLLNR